MSEIKLDDTFTELVTFELKDSSAQQELLKCIAAQSEPWIRQCSGFISANLHVSIDGKYLVNYAQWRSKEDWEAFTKNPRYPQLMDAIKEVGPVSVNDRAYSVALILTTAEAPATDK